MGLNTYNFVLLKDMKLFGLLAEQLPTFFKYFHFHITSLWYDHQPCAQFWCAKVNHLPADYKKYCIEFNQ